MWRLRRGLFTKKETKTTNANENIKVQDNYNCCIVKYLLHLSHMMLLWFVSFENIWLLQLLDAIPIAITIPIQWRKIQRSNKERYKKSLQKLTIQQRKNYRICLRFAASFFIVLVFLGEHLCAQVTRAMFSGWRQFWALALASQNSSSILPIAFVWK